MNTSTPTYKNHRFPPEIISHGVWLYFRFCLSYRDVEELLFARGISVTYKTIQKWCLKFGQAYANQWGPALPLAGRRSGWPCPGYSCPKPSKQEGGEEVFPQAAEGIDLRTAG